MSPVLDFFVIPELRLIVAASSDNLLRLFKIDQNKITGELECSIKGSFKKETNSKIVEVHFLQKENVIVALSSDNKLDVFKVNIENKESILKKLMRQKKRKVLKRK